MRLAGDRASILGVLGFVLFSAGAGAALAQGAATRVGVDRVIVEPFSQTVPVLGRFVARQAGPVAALVAGPVDRVLVDVGDRVATNDVLVRLSTDNSVGNRDLRVAELRQSEAALETARAQVRLSELELRRLESLKQSPAFSQARYDDKQAEVMRFRSSVAEAEAAVMRAGANLELAELDLRRSEIRAPYDGVVVTRQTSDGAYVTVGSAVVTLVNDRDLEIEADVPSDRLAGLAPGHEINARLDSGVSFTAEVRAIVPTENALTRTRPVRFTPDMSESGPLRLATDQSVTVLLPVGERREVVTVHKDAVVQRGLESTVFVVEDGKAAQRVVRLGEAVGTRFEVLDGLAPGDIVVTLGNERLRPGQPVTFEPPPAPRGDG